jgi:anti-sigma28 factor (negative regulator of flagellin synthesis)
MKNTTSETDLSTKTTEDVASAGYIQRRDLSLRNKSHRNAEIIPDLKTARNMAEQLEILERHVATAPIVNIQHRNSIRQAIATGGYVIDPTSIASKFLKFEDDLYS